jgi:hypothetical protein
MAHNFSRNAMRIRVKKYGDNLGRKAYMSTSYHGKSSAKNKKALLYRRGPSVSQALIRRLLRPVFGWQFMTTT